MGNEDPYMINHTMGEIMDIACRAGKLILQNGGEIYRVEDTMLYICKAFGLSHCECYATPTSIILSVLDSDGESHSRMMRIATRGVNLHTVESVNTLSRELMHTPMTLAQARQSLLAIERAAPYSLWVMLLALALGTGAFTVEFTGGFGDFIYGMLMGAALRLVVSALTRIEAGAFTTNLFGGAMAALGGWLMTRLGLIDQWWIITFSALMLLVPGLLFTNAMRDTASGDLLSGISRGMEALSIVGALAFGAGATLMLLTRLGGV